MSARSRHSNDDLNLSLSGSQIHSASASSRSRPGSAKQLKRPNSVTDIRTKERKTKVGLSSTSKKTGHVAGDNEDTTHRSEISDISSVSQRVSKKGKSPGDDFLALFESSVQPKIKGTSSKPKKTGPNAVKVIWGDPVNPPLKNKFALKSQKNKDTDERDNWGDSKGNRHSIFEKKSARSSSDEEDFRFSDRLSQSFNGTLKNSSEKQNSERNFSVDDDAHREESVRNFLSENLQRGVSPRNGKNHNRGGHIGIANNKTVQGMSPGIKVGLSGLENSYQNIKHKTPVNQVRKVSSASQGANNVTEDYINTLNTAATKIQRWFRRHHSRHKAGRAAMQRLFGNKRQMLEDQRLRESQNDFMDPKAEERKQEERKRAREEKAKIARQQAIQDLQKKREDKRHEVKKKAEQEIAYLQASGKITKAPLKTGFGKKKGTSKPSKGSPTSRDSNINTHQESSPERDTSNNLYEDDGQASRTAESEHGTKPTSSRTPRDFLGDRNTVSGTREGRDIGSAVGTSEVTTKTTLDDLFETLKKLEEEEHLATARPSKKNSWLDDLDRVKDDDEDDSRSLSTENLRRLNKSKTELPTKSSLLSDDKMRSIMSFLDEVQVADRLSSVDQEISKISMELEKPPLLGPSAEELAELEQANQAASEVTNTVLSQRLELDERSRTVTMLQRALNQQRELTVRHAKETEKEMKKRLDLQKDDYEETIKRHLGFIDQLIDDKKSLGEKCENLVKELKTIDKKYQDKLRSITDTHSIEMQKLKDMHEAAEKLRREKWIEDKTKKIKEMTVKGLEPEIQRLIAKHKGELKKVKHIHDAELLEADERAAQRYVKMTEELRDQLAEEKEAACGRERELAKQRYEKQIRQEEDAYQQQRRRLMTEVQEEKDRLASQASRQRSDLDKLQRQLEESHSHALEAMRSEFEKAREEQERRHATETRELKERMSLEKDAWEENYKKKQENWLMSKERELKENVKKERNKEIELVIRQLEEDATAAREDCERVAENRIKRIREKYDSEIREMERSERQAMERYNEMKARLTEVEGENECVKVTQKQKDTEINDLKKLTDKMHRERDRVSDIIRQEFADRLVFTEEENKRIKNEISELKARQRIELQRSKDEIEEIKRQKDEEMEEVHKRVKDAIVKKEEVVTQLKQQYQAALKRADHLEGLLQQQRKQLLGK